jgi:uncharacterized circularly permuted ATP-grasp superfamily protein
MAATTTPAIFDEAFDAPGAPRGAYGRLLDRLEDVGFEPARRQVRDRMAAEGCTFGAGEDSEAFRLDPVPRVITADEWEPLACGLEQRVRALDAFLADLYDARRIIDEGVMPARVIARAEHFEQDLVGTPAPRVRVALAGLDVIRTPDGEFQVLEDNLRTPSGLAYTFAARRAVGDLFAGTADPVPVEEPALALLEHALRSAAPEGVARPRIALLTDGPKNTAFWEHARLAELLELPLIDVSSFHPTSYDVVYRRTDEDRLRDARGRLTRIGSFMLDGLRAGTLACVNALGNGAADDKLVHAYVEDMIRFYLGEEPRLRSVPTYDLALDDHREEVLDRLAEMVVKPRSGYGGAGVFVGPQCGAEERDRVATAVRADPEEWIAQETVFFSHHPTVIDGRIQPRHVDLRPYVVFDGERAAAVPGGLTRVAYPEGELVVNSSQGGGGKDTWVLAS